MNPASGELSLSRIDSSLIPAHHPALTFALLGDLLFFVCAKNSKKESAPNIRPCCAGFPRSTVAPRAGIKGHPWPLMPFAASMRLTPLHNSSTRPPDGSSPRCCLNVLCSGRTKSLCASTLFLLKTPDFAPRISPSGGSTECLCSGLRDRMSRKLRRTINGPSQRAHGADTAGAHPAKRGRMRAARFCLLFTRRK